MQEFEERAQAIGGEIAKLFPGFLETAHSRRHIAPHTVCMRAIMDAVQTHPDLNDRTFVDTLLHQSLNYTTGAAPVAFQQALVVALKRCTLQGVRLAVAFPEGGSIKLGSMTAIRPGVCDSLAIMTELAKAGVFPQSEAALLNCYRRLMGESIPWIATRAVARAIQGNPAAFARDTAEASA